MFAICGFNATSPCCWEKRSSSSTKFTGVELVGDAELAAPVEKVAAGPVEKAAASHSGGEGGHEA